MTIVTSNSMTLAQLPLIPGFHIVCAFSWRKMDLNSHQVKQSTVVWPGRIYAHDYETYQINKRMHLARCCRAALKSTQACQDTSKRRRAAAGLEFRAALFFWFYSHSFTDVGRLREVAFLEFCSSCKTRNAFHFGELHAWWKHRSNFTMQSALRAVRRVSSIEIQASWICQ